MDLTQLTLEQLAQVRTQVDSELRALESSLAQLTDALARYQTSLDAARALGAEQPQELMVPLSMSVYAPGRTVPSGKLTVDIGTGLYVRVAPKEAEAVLQRKVDYVKKNIAAFRSQFVTKRGTLEAVSGMHQRRVQERLSAAPAAAAAPGSAAHAWTRA